MTFEDAAGRAAIFSVCAVRDNLHVPNRFDGWADHKRGLVDEVDDIDVVVNAVQQEVVLTGRANAVRREAAAQCVARALAQPAARRETAAPER